MKEVICIEQMGGGIGIHAYYKPIRELVRCKDCRHAELKHYGMGEKYACIKSEYEGCFDFHEGDWFCANGEMENKHEA